MDRRIASPDGYVGSYLWRLLQAVGNDLVLMPGAMIAPLDEDRRVLMTKARRRRDLVPAGQSR